MGKFFDLFEQAREKQRALKPLVPEVVSAPTPIQSLMEKKSLAIAWEKIMRKLEPMHQVIDWLADKDANLYERLSTLERLCHRNADEGKEHDFQATKKQYLIVLGEICELYYREKGWQVINFMSPGLGMQHVAICLTDEQATAVPDGTLVFRVHEFPTLITADQNQLEDLCKVKAGIPGAVVSRE